MENLKSFIESKKHNMTEELTNYVKNTINKQNEALENVFDMYKSIEYYEKPIIEIPEFIGYEVYESIIRDKIKQNSLYSYKGDCKYIELYNNLISLLSNNILETNEKILKASEQANIKFPKHNFGYLILDLERILQTKLEIPRVYSKLVINNAMDEYIKDIKEYHTSMSRKNKTHDIETSLERKLKKEITMQQTTIKRIPEEIKDIQRKIDNPINKFLSIHKSYKGKMEKLEKSIHKKQSYLENIIDNQLTTQKKEAILNTIKNLKLSKKQNKNDQLSTWLFNGSFQEDMENEILKVLKLQVDNYWLKFVRLSNAIEDKFTLFFFDVSSFDKSKLSLEIIKTCLSVNDLGNRIINIEDEHEYYNLAKYCINKYLIYGDNNLFDALVNGYRLDYSHHDKNKIRTFSVQRTYESLNELWKFLEEKKNFESKYFKDLDEIKNWRSEKEEMESTIEQLRKDKLEITKLADEKKKLEEMNIELKEKLELQNKEMVEQQNIETNEDEIIVDPDSFIFDNEIKEEVVKLDFSKYDAIKPKVWKANYKEAYEEFSKILPYVSEVKQKFKDTKKIELFLFDEETKELVYEENEILFNNWFELIPEED